ncbi:MAG: HAMP domain-containing sensor histidine kinase, partial [Armatimonadia bacterium]
ADLRASTDHMTAFEISRPGTHPPLLLDARLTRVLDESNRLQSAVLIVRDVTDERLPRHVQASFMTAVPHKLRTPLSVLLGYLSVAKHLPLSELPKQWPHISGVWEGELRDLISLVDKLLDFEQLTSRELEAELVETDVAAAATEVFARVRERHPEREAEFSLEVGPDAARAGRSADHLRFILKELMDNAIKFADKQPARVILEVAAEESCRLRFTVTDNGPGIPHEYYDQIFDDFIQVEEHVTGQVPGWGVGLRMVRHVVESYGGEISVTSRLGEGSAFTFTWPAACRS